MLSWQVGTIQSCFFFLWRVFFWADIPINLTSFTMFFLWLRVRLGCQKWLQYHYNYHLYHTLYINFLKYLKMKNKHQQIRFKLEVNLQTLKVFTWSPQLWNKFKSNLRRVSTNGETSLMQKYLDQQSPKIFSWICK